MGQVYRPPSAPSVWIEHGHQHDVCNNFIIGAEDRWSEDRLPILKDSAGEARLLECVGTRFLLNFLNRLDSAYPFVNNIKPFSKFIKMFGVSALRWDHGPIKAAVAIWGMLKFLGTTMGKSPRDFLGIPGDERPPLAAAVKASWERLPEAERGKFVERLRGKGIATDTPLCFLLEDAHEAERVLDVLAEDFTLAEMLPEPGADLLSLEGDGEEGTLALIDGYLANESAGLVRAARAALQHSGASAVVMGHTHEPQSHPDGLSYVNTGSWTRYLRMLETGPQPSSWSLLKREAIANFPYNLLYAEISTLQPQIVHLQTWRSTDDT